MDFPVCGGGWREGVVRLNECENDYVTDLETR